MRAAFLSLRPLLKACRVVLLLVLSRDVAQSGRVPALGAGCRRFESCRPERFNFSHEDNNMSQRYVRISRLSKTATQSGRALADAWIATFPKTEGPVVAKDAWRSLPDAVMGWHGGGETKEQVRLAFPTREAACAWAKAQGLLPIVQPEQGRRIRPKSYAANFAHDRPVPWTH